MSSDGFLDVLPPDHRPKPTHAELAAEIRSRPRLWKKVGSYANRAGAAAVASMIRTGQRPAWRKRPDGHYDAEPRTTKTREHLVYVRWVPTTTTTPRSAA